MNTKPSTEAWNQWEEIHWAYRFRPTGSVQENPLRMNTGQEVSQLEGNGGRGRGVVGKRSTTSRKGEGSPDVSHIEGRGQGGGRGLQGVGHLENGRGQSAEGGVNRALKHMHLRQHTSSAYRPFLDIAYQHTTIRNTEHTLQEDVGTRTVREHRTDYTGREDLREEISALRTIRNIPGLWL